ncbi:helix-turn-helix family protein [Bacillus cereus ATCC 4342]|nr:helix-turn-helix family protein [Bacillus cereus ATCC 4342]KFM87974.1 helix-turn-helix family protein [Bacillus cereus ATCC 4342]
MSVSKIKIARVEKGLTQQELADIVNVHDKPLVLLKVINITLL